MKRLHRSTIDVTSHHITSHHITWHHVTWHHITLHNITLHNMTLCYTTSHSITWKPLTSKGSVSTFMIRSNRSPSSHSPFALCITRQSSWCRIKVLSLGSAVSSILLRCSLVLCGVWLMRSKGPLDWAERRWQLAPIELSIWRNVPWPYGLRLNS